MHEYKKLEPSESYLWRSFGKPLQRNWELIACGVIVTAVLSTTFISSAKASYCFINYAKQEFSQPPKDVTCDLSDLVNVIEETFFSDKVTQD